MAEDSFDFERQWLNKLSRGLDEGNRGEILAGSEHFSDQTPNDEIISWSQSAMTKLQALVKDEEACIDIMTGCACHYSKEKLEPIREKYQSSKDIDLALEMLQTQFENLLRDDLNLSEEMIADIVSRGWGSAGIRKGNSIIATKIPKSGYLEAYMQEENPEKKRAYYCHCPRVRKVLEAGDTLPEIYCYCGGGFYQGIWEEILQVPVRIRLLKSIMKDDEICQFEVRLPAESS